MQASLQNKIILITGGTGGLGQALVRTFSGEGAQVLFTYHTHSDRAKEMEKCGARGHEVDLAKRSSVKDLIRRLSGLSGRLDGIIHNAGITRDHTVTNLSESEFDECMEVNLNSVFLLSQGLLPLLEQSSLPKIINVVSRTGLRGTFGQVAYAASKAGLIALTKTMAAEWGPKRVLVNAITPGYLMSDMTQDVPESVHQRARDESYLGVISDAEEVASFAAYLMSDQVTRLTGQIFHYDTRKN